MTEDRKLAPRDSARGSGRGSKRGMAGGSLLAISILAGVVIGTVYRQPSIGFLVGFGIGLLLLLVVWALDRRRRG